MNDAIQTIWHQGYERALRTITSLRNHSDFKYEKDTENARKVIILNADKPLIRKYTPWTAIKRDKASVTKQEFEMDQMYYFNVGIDHVIKAQPVDGALEAICEEGAIALTEEGDKYVASLVKGGVDAGTVAVIDGTSVTKTNAIDKVEEGFAVLYGNNCKINSPEFAWSSKNLVLTNSNAESEYFMLRCENFKLNNFFLNGKYSFQYVKNGLIEDSKFETKDAFWHAKNIIIKDSILNGEYLAWYSKNLTLINCSITGTQPFCYCKNLKLINCKMINTDLSFEKSQVHATIINKMDSIKNPYKGKIIVKDVKEIIIDDKRAKAKIIKKKEAF